MKSRLKYVREYEKLSQKRFGEMLNLSQPQIASYESGHRGIPDRVVSDVCRVFKISEPWLRTGKGEMFDLEEEKDYINHLINHSDNPLVKNIMQKLDGLDDKYLQAILTLIEGIKK